MTFMIATPLNNPVFLLIKKLIKQPVILLTLLVCAVIFIGYKDVFIQGKIPFPSNYLAHFYSPWSTDKFVGWEQGIPNKPIGTDPTRFFFPAWNFAASEVNQGRIPLWNPHLFSGNVVLADLQSALFYPANWLYFVLPTLQAWNILHFLPYFLAAIFMFAFLRSYGANSAGSIFGSLCYVFSSYFLAWNQENPVVINTACYLPLLLYTIHNYFRTEKIKYLVLFSFSWAISFFAGHFQTDFYLSVLSIFYFLFNLYKTKVTFPQKMRTFIIFILFWLLGLAVISVQLLPSIEAFILSARPAVNEMGTLYQYLVSPAYLFNILIADWQGNPGAYNYFGKGFYHETTASIFIFGSVLALFASISRTKNHIFFIIAAVITFFLATDNLVSRVIINSSLPLVSTFIPSRIFLLTVFSLSVLAGLGCSELFTNDFKNKRKLLYISAIIPCLLIIAVNLFNILSYLSPVFSGYPKVSFQQFPVLFRSYVHSNLFITLKNSAIPTLLLFIFIPIIRLKPRYIFIFILIANIFLQTWFLNKYFMPGEKDFFYAPSYTFDTLKEQMSPIDRFVTFGNRIMPNLFLNWRISSPEGLNPIFNYEYGQLVDATKNHGQINMNIPRVEVFFSDLEPGELITANLPRLRLLSLLGVKYFAFYQDPNKSQQAKRELIFPEDKFSLLSNHNNWYIYLFKDALPRVFLADKYEILTDRQKLADKMFTSDFDLTKTLIFSQKISFPSLSTLTSEDKVEIINYFPQHIEIKTLSSGPKLLFISDTYNPGWQAYLDGGKVNIYKADGAFRAVFIPAGQHHIDMKYEPKLFYLGMIITLATVAGFGLYGGVSLARKHV